GVSSIRLVPFLVATAVGVVPGTVAVVVLGDALTGRTDPALVVVSVLCAAIGVVGLLVDARLESRNPTATNPPAGNTTGENTTAGSPTVRESDAEGADSRA
ncbi:TVP38/TMEM64 family protein, partial [Actinosynnema sp. NPDC023658]